MSTLATPASGEDPMRIFACVVTYEPDLELLAANLAAVTGQVAGVIVVDNASIARSTKAHSRSLS